MQFVADFLLWSLVVGIALCIPLFARAWRAEVIRGDDPRFRPTGVFPRIVRAIRRPR